MEQFSKIEVYEIWCGDLDSLIMKHYNLDDFESTLESLNDTCYLHDIYKEPLNKYEQVELEGFINRKSCEYVSISTILQDMCNKDIIPEGNYLINVSW